MATEEQLLYNQITGVYGGGTEGFGQHLTISDRIVSKLSFPLSKINSPTGDIIFVVRLANTPFTVIYSKVLKDASLLTTYPTVTWEEIEFDTPVNIDDLVIIGFRFSGGDASNVVVAHTQNTDVKADEVQVRHDGSEWIQFAGDETAYIYTYTAVPVPTVTTDPATAIR